MKKKKKSVQKKSARRPKKKSWKLPALFKRSSRRRKPSSGRLSSLIRIALLVLLAYMAGKYGFHGLIHSISNHTSPNAHRTPAARTAVIPPSKTAAPSPKSPPVAKRHRVLSADKPKLVFVIDDMGHTLSYRTQLDRLGDNITYAILPLLAHSTFYGNYSARTGAEVILHLPLEASDGTIPGPGLITGRMPESQVLDVLDRGLKSIPHHVGLNNHMGSRGTSDGHLMRIILNDLKKRDLFFLDSMTTAQSISPSIAREIHLPILKRDVFLDNVDSPAAIRTQVRELSMVARKKGYAIAIGHYRFNTLNVLIEEIPVLKRQGYEIVSLSDLLHFLDR
ncbi:MAG: divergent polysaccharide deacetylase family protein [Candidatus Omnitrophica bacterium]|nr:divergent polysaccharide deacetylase family protein [Candidatus Omnitrophota bacterium]